MVNHVDIAPPFAGTLFGISNTCATLPGILAPYAVALLTPGVRLQNIYFKILQEPKFQTISQPIDHSHY